MQTISPQPTQSRSLGHATWLWVIALWCLAPMALADSIGTVIMARGEVTAEDADGEVRSLSRRSEVHVGDHLTTGEQSRLQIRMVDDALLDLRSDTELTLEVYSDASADAESRVLMELVNGTLSSLTGQFGRDDEDNYQLRSANASIGIRGTSFSALYDSAANTTYTSVDAGGVDLSNAGGAVQLGPDAAFSHGRAIADQPPQGLLTPPPAMREALLDADMLREQEEEGDAEDEDASEADASNGDDSAPAPSAFDDDDALGDLAAGEIQDDSLTEGDLALAEEEPELIDPRISNQVAEDAETSIFQLNTASIGLGENHYGIWVADENERIPYLLLYNERPDLRGGYVAPEEVVRLTDAPVDGTNEVFCEDDSGGGLGLFCNQQQDTQEWFWGYWEAGTSDVAQSTETSEYASLEQGIWVMEIDPDPTVDFSDNNNTANILFSGSTVPGSTGNDSDGNLLSVDFGMEVSPAGVVQEGASLFIYSQDSAAGVPEWNLTSGSSHEISNGELTIDDFAGQVTDAGDEFPASGAASGVFREDGNLYYFLGTFVTEVDQGDLSAAGVIISEEQQ